MSLRFTSISGVRFLACAVLLACAAIPATAGEPEPGPIPTAGPSQSTLTGTWSADQVCADFVLSTSALIVELTFTVQMGPGAFTTSSGTGPSGEVLDQTNGYCGGDGQSQSCIGLALGSQNQIRACATMSGFDSSTAVVVSGSAYQLTSTQVISSITLRPPRLVNLTVSKFEDLTGDGVYQQGVDLPVNGHPFCILSDQSFTCTPGGAIGVTGASGQLVLTGVEMGGLNYLTEPASSEYTVTSAGGAIRTIDPLNPPAAPVTFLNFWYGQVSGRLIHDWYGTGDSASGACPADSYPQAGACVPCAQVGMGAPCGSYPGVLTLTKTGLAGGTSTVQVQPAADGAFSYVALGPGSFTLGAAVSGFVVGQSPSQQVTSRAAFQQDLYYYIPASYSWRPVDPTSGNLVPGGTSTLSCPGESGLPALQTGPTGVMTWTGVRPGLTCQLTYAPPSGWELAQAGPAQFVTRSGDAVQVDVALQPAALTVSITARQDLNGDGIAASGDPALSGVLVCADLGLDGTCGTDDPSATTDTDGQGAITVPGTHRSPFDLRLAVDPATTLPSLPTSGTYRVDPAAASTSAYEFLVARYGSIEIDVFRDRFLQGDAAPACVFGQEPALDGASCVPCATGPAGDLCRARPSSLTLSTSPECTDCALPFEPAVISVVDGVAAVPRVPPGLFVGSLADGGSGYRLAAAQTRVESGQAVRIRYRVWRPATLSVRMGEDTNGNGLIDDGEGIGGGAVTVIGPRLAGGLDESLSLTGDGAGLAALDGLIPGAEVQVISVPPSGWRVNGNPEVTFVPESGGSTVVHVLYLEGQAGEALDFGDAPAEADASRPDSPFGYPVLLASDGARHRVVPGFFLGSGIDAELDGRAGLFADADGRPAGDDGVDLSGSRDALWFRKASGGFVALPMLVAGTPEHEIHISPSAAGLLDAWIDWDGNGSWDEPAERIFDSEPVQGPSDTRRIAVPAGARPGITYARFRFSLGGGLGPAGYAPDGEVEDYAVVVMTPQEVTSLADADDLTPGDGFCADAAGTCTLRAALQEAAASGTPTYVDLSAAGKSGRAVISPVSPLPTVTTPLVIQGGGTAVLDGAAAGPLADGLRLEVDGMAVSGLTIRSFAGNGISITGSRNVIRASRLQDNGLAGVRVTSGGGNRVRETTFSGNGGRPIDLPATGPSPLSPPRLTAVTAENSRVQGSVTGQPGRAYPVDVFASQACHASGFGEGDRLVGSFTVATDSGGAATFDRSLVGTLALGESVTATVSGVESGTSTFSACFVAVTTAVEGPGVETPTGFQLAQNYPNPFNPSTRIDFTVPGASRVRLSVHDLLGKPVRILLDDVVGPGTHSVVFEAQDLPSGVYVYRLEAPTGTFSRALLLLK